MSEYNNESITALKGPDKVRKRPSVIFGSDGILGCQHAVFEILSNSIDEAREGFGKVIEVTRFKDNSVMVKDRGRGIPLEFNTKEGRYNWELVFCELYAGGKYNNNSGTNYTYSLGLNGLGSCATQFASEYMDVEVVRDGYIYTLHFEKGINIGGLKKEPYEKRGTGTTIKWKPDLDVFTDINISSDFYIDTIKKQAVVNKGIRFIFNNENDDGKFEKHEFLYENGIVDYLTEKSEFSNFTDVVFYETERIGRDRDDKADYKLKMQVAFCFGNEKNFLEYYHNSSFLEHGGSPDKAVRNAFTYAIDRYIKDNSKYTKNESKITFADVEDSLMFISNSFSTETSYENQTKKAITNLFIQTAMTEFLKEKLNIYFIENKASADKIADQILLNKRSRETAEKTRLNIKKKLSAPTDITNKIQKFVDCRTKDVTRREIYIVEGDSAVGSCKQGRNAEFQAIMPVRGKILNCLKADYNKIFKNEIIIDLMRVLGCGVEVKTKQADGKFSTFNIDNFRWNKVIICTDADVDGFQIRTLILTMLYRLVPTLVREGKVFIAESPLFEINIKDKTYFAYNEREKAEILAKAEGSKYTIQRSKGLGENEPEMMWQTTMNPETRRLIKIMPEDVVKTEEMFDIMLGDNLQGRKNYISEFGYEYIDKADIS